MGEPKRVKMSIAVLVDDDVTADDVGMMVDELPGVETVNVEVLEPEFEEDSDG